jgi:hypothetical protein
MTVRHELTRQGKRLGTAVVALSLLFGLQTIAAPPAQAISATLTVSGTLKVGETLSPSPSGFSTTPSTYAWYSYSVASGGSGAWVSGASTYTLGAGDVGHYLAVFTSTDGGVLSERVGPIEAVVITPGTPVVNGTAMVGVTLWVDPGTWDPVPDSYSYQWLRDASEITGATSDLYRLVAADLGKKISVRVTGTKTGYDDATATSAQTDAVVATPPATLTAFTASDVVISSGRCVHVPVSATYQVSTYEAWAVTKVTLTSKVTNKRGKKLGTVTLTGSGPDFTPISVGSVSPKRRADLIGTATGTFLWCTGDYLGAIKFAAPKGTWTGTYESAAVGGSITSTLTATGHVKAALRLATPKLTVKGTKRTLTATFKTWVPDVKGWRALVGTKVTVQKLVDGSWVKLKTIRLSASGKVKTSWKATESASYRLAYAGSSITTDGVTAVVTG